MTGTTLSSKKYSTYPEYKDSGVEWLGSIPSHWDSWKLKHTLSSPLLYGANEAALDENKSDPRYIRITDMNNDGSLRDDTFKSLPMSLAQNYLLDDGDLLFARSGATVGKSFLYNSLFGKSCFAGYLIKASCNNRVLVSRYAYWFCQSDQYWKYISGSQIQSTIQNVSAEKYGEMKIPFSLKTEEQQKIVSFLDHETTKIDTLIAKQDKLIGLLKEKRQTVISHAVTRGLNPNTPMKHSSVECLGEVPVHWVVCCLKHIKGKSKGSFVDGPFGSNLKSEHFVDNGDVYVIESNFATTGVLDKSKLKTISNAHFATISRSETKQGSIIIAKIGARYGMNSIMPTLDKRAVVSGNSLSLTVDTQRMNVDYCHHLLTHLKREEAMDDGVNVTAQPALSLGQLNNLPFLALPLEEQSEIVCFIEEQEKYFSSLILNSEKMIELSKERKTALISAAVTGKIDVRSWQSEVE
jgi:type I restriction enzyme S subunit